MYFFTDNWISKSAWKHSISSLLHELHKFVLSYLVSFNKTLVLGSSVQNASNKWEKGSKIEVHKNKTQWHLWFKGHWENTTTDISAPQTFHLTHFHQWDTKEDSCSWGPNSKTRGHSFGKCHLHRTRIFLLEATIQPDSGLTKSQSKVPQNFNVFDRSWQIKSQLWLHQLTRTEQLKNQTWFLEPSLLMRMNGTKQFSFCTYQQAYCFFPGKI